MENASLLLRLPNRFDEWGRGLNRYAYPQFVLLNSSRGHDDCGFARHAPPHHVHCSLNPVSYARNRVAFEWRRDEVNVVLAFSGLYVREDGKVVHSTSESTLAGARLRAG